MPVLFKQAVSVIDSRTTNVCLAVAGQIVAVDALFSTLNGDFDAPPFHINCRTMVSPYMSGFVNDQRALSNAELQRRPRATRDTRGAPTPPPDRNNPPTRNGRARPEPKGPAPTPRGRALDVAEARRARTSATQARSNRDRIARMSPEHRTLMNAVTRVTKGQALGTAQARVLRETVRAAPATKTTMWLAVPAAGARRYSVGGTVPNPEVLVFTAAREQAQRELADGGVLIQLPGGRALPVEHLTSPGKRQWLVARTLRVVGIKDGPTPGTTIVVVETE